MKKLIIVLLFVCLSHNACATSVTAQDHSTILDAVESLSTCANDGLHALVYPSSGTFACAGISSGGLPTNPTFTGILSGSNSLYPEIPSVVTTTANATSGSAVIAVASATGISVGMPVTPTSGSWLPSDGVYVVGVSGTSITLSYPASTNETGTGITFGIAIYDSNNGIMTNTIGAKNGYFGQQSQGNSWINDIFVGADWSNNNSFISVALTGNGGGIFASRASDAGTYTGGNIGVSALALNDDSTHGSNAWGGYFQCNQNSGAMGGCAGIEIDTANFYSGSVAFDPYATPPSGADSILAVASGAGYPYANDSRTPTPVSVGEIIYANGGKIDTGIMIRDLSLNGQNETTGTGEAIALPINSLVNWYYGTGDIGASIYSNVSQSSSKQTLEFNNTGFELFGNTGNLLMADQTTNPMGDDNALIINGATDAGFGLEIAGSIAANFTSGASYTAFADQRSGSSLQFVNYAGVAFYAPGTGGAGIYNTSPQATLDINGYTRLKKYSSQPLACSSTNDGAIALTALYTLCVCNGGSNVWVEASNGTTACTW